RAEDRRVAARPARCDPARRARAGARSRPQRRHRPLLLRQRAQLRHRRVLDRLVVSGCRRVARADRARRLRGRLRRAERRPGGLDDDGPAPRLARRRPDDPRERLEPRPAPRAGADRGRADEGGGGERRARPHLRAPGGGLMERTTGIVGELRHGILSVVDALAQSVALLSLALGVAFASSAAAGETGIAAPFAYLIAGVGSLCLASVIIRFTRRMASAGGLYTYISRGLNPSAGFLGGWLYGGGFAVGISFVLVIGSFFMSTAFTAHTSLHWGWYPWFFIMLAAVAVISFFDVRI